MKHYDVIGVLPLDAFGGIEVLSINYGIDDTVLFRWNHGSPGKTTRAKVRSNASGRMFFVSRGIRRFIDEVQHV